jgi:hypothetical protein
MLFLVGNLMWAGRLIVGLLFGYLAIRLVQRSRLLLREKTYKALAITLLGIAASLFLSFYFVWQEIPTSQKTLHRKGAYLGSVDVCTSSSRFKDCAPSDNCAACESRVGCLDALDKYYDICFDTLYNEWVEDHWVAVRSSEFYPSLNSCLSWITKFAQHEADRGQMKESQSVAGFVFPVFGEAAATV